MLHATYSFELWFNAVVDKSEMINDKTYVGDILDIPIEFSRELLMRIYQYISKLGHNFITRIN